MSEGPEDYLDLCEEAMEDYEKGLEIGTSIRLLYLSFRYFFR